MLLQNINIRNAILLFILFICAQTVSIEAKAQVVSIREADLTSSAEAKKLEETNTFSENPEEKFQLQNNKTKTNEQIHLFTGIGSTSEDNYTPMNGKELWSLYWRSTFFSPGALIRVVVPAAGDQISNSPPEWGRNSGGYGKRVASRFGNRLISNSVQFAGSALLGQDPRYIRSSKKGFFKRSAHAFEFVFVTFNKEGKIRPAIANIAGTYAGGIGQVSWYPERYTFGGDGVRNGNIGLAFNFVNNLIVEFSPDIKKIFRH